MDQRIIYKNDDGTIALVIPAPECPLTVEQIALKDVPVGKTFKIIDASEVPEDTASWVVDDAELTDGVGADYGIGSDNPFILQEV
jgi:hypothetical protein